MKSGLGLRLLMQYAQITGVLKNPLLPDPEFLPAVILASTAKNFAVATLTGMASPPQSSLLFLTSRKFFFLVSCRKPSPLSY